MNIQPSRKSISLPPPLPIRFHRNSACILIAILIAVITNLSLAAPIPERISFQNIVENKDFSMGEGSAFLQDSQGFMWLGGGNALIRYDGYEFRQFYFTGDENKPNEKFPPHVVNYLFEDSRHIIWVATRVGLLRYDPHTEKLIKIKDDESQPVRISDSDIRHALELPSGEILLSSSVGLLLINPDTNKYDAIALKENKKNEMLVNNIFISYLSANGELWLGTATGLIQVDWKTKTFTQILFNPDEVNSVLNLQVKDVRDIVSDNDGELWLATKSGLVHYDAKTHRGKLYAHDPGNQRSLGGNDVAKLLIDSQKVLWVGSDGGGVSVYDKDADRFINYQAEQGRPGALNTNKVRTLYEDRNGDIWVGNFPTGVNFYDRSTAPVTTYTANAANPHSLSYTSVLSASEDSKGNLWLGTDGGGLNFFDREKNEFTHLKNIPNDPTSLNGDSVLTTLVDSSGLVWVGTWGQGLASYNPADKKFTRYPFSYNQEPTENGSTSAVLNNPTVWSIKEDKHHQLWIGTHFGGVSKFNPQTKLFTHYRNMDNDPSSLSSGLAWTTLEDSKGELWVGTAVGLNLMDQAKGTFTRFMANPKDPTTLSSSNILSIFEDSKNRLWFGTDSGLNLYNRETKKFTAYNKSNGFFNDTIRDVLEDLDGTLWVSTNNGFSSFNPETLSIKNYSRLGGRLVGAFATHSGALSRNGEIIFGGVDGLRIFNPRALSENKKIPPIAFTDFKIFSDSVVAGGSDKILTKVINHTDSIKLDYKKSMFTFSFSALNYRDSEKNKYAYKLEGFDKNWLDAGTQRTAKYTNLDAGTYVFKVKGSNNDGLWNDEGKAITIIQLPPPWKTWWAYTLYGLIIITAIVLFVHYQRKKRREVEEQNRLLEIKVLERTAELREKNNDIQTMLSNMRQGLFTIETGGHIHPEYSLFLENIFETKDIAGQDALKLLFEKASLGSDVLDKLKASVNAIIGEDEINFEFNSHLLVEEYKTDFNGKAKFISLHWSPVVAGTKTVKLMVSARDVTLLKKMEHEALSKKRELEMISQLLNVSAKKYLSFSASTKTFIAENRTHIENNEQLGAPTIALLFRNMHTIKGNCRTYNFDQLSNVVHEVESVYSALQADQSARLEKNILLKDLARVESILQEYERIYYSVLRRSETTTESRDQQGFWADSKAIGIIQEYIDATKPKPLTSTETQHLLPIQSLLNNALSNPISEVLTDILSSLPSIALQLNKEAPRVIIADNHVRINFSATELITNIFAHILRNSVDHGLETAAVRLQKGKPDAGTIEIRAIPQQHNLHIHIKDDGQGISIDRLFNKGVEIGTWNAGDKPSYSDIANLIFASGVSTKEAVTTISGRGVGMDAVKEFLLAQGGNISLQLLGPNANSNSIGQGVMVPFELIIELPNNAFVVMN